MKKVGLIIGFFVLIWSLKGCASNGFLMAKPKVTMLGNAYPPKEENESIEIFMTSLPTQEFIELAQIKIRDTNDKWCIEQIEIKAREIGADAIIIIGKAGSYSTGVPIGELTYIVNNTYGMTAIAVKYKENSQDNKE